MAESFLAKTFGEMVCELTGELKSTDLKVRIEPFGLSEDQMIHYEMSDTLALFTLLKRYCPLFEFLFLMGEDRENSLEWTYVFGGMKDSSRLIIKTTKARLDVGPLAVPSIRSLFLDVLLYEEILEREGWIRFMGEDVSPKYGEFFVETQVQQKSENFFSFEEIP